MSSVNSTCANPTGKKGFKKHLLFSLLAIFVLGGFAYATTIVSNSGINTPYTNITDSNYKVSRTADVVVCRGTSVLDDLYKSVTCDVVCKSTDDDCQQELQSTLGTSCNNKNVVWMPGNYPLLTRDQISSTAFLVSYCSNFTLDGYGAKLYPSYNTDNKDQKGFEIEGSNTIIKGVSLYGNKVNSSTTGNNNYGFRFYGYMNNSGLIDCSSSDVYGFQVTLEPIAESYNLFLENFKGKGIGTNDVIGGGGSGKSYGFRISNSYIEQVLDKGSYSNALDLVWVRGLTVTNTISYGGLLIGTEGGISTNVNFVGNTVYPARNADGSLQSSSWFGFSNGYVYNSTIVGNVVYGTLNNGDTGTNNIIGNTFLTGTKQTEVTKNNLVHDGNVYFNDTAVYGSNQNMTRKFLIESNNRGLWFTDNAIFNSLDSRGIYRFVTRTGDYGAGIQVWDSNTNNVTFFANSKNGGSMGIPQNNSAMTCGAGFTSGEGMIYYDGVTKKHYGCDGTTWRALY